MRSLLATAFAAAMTVQMAAGQAEANLQARGAVNPLNGYPTWYQDTSGLALALCLDQTPVAPNGPTACVLTEDFDPDPAVAALRTPPGSPVKTITPDKEATPIDDTTFPVEAFYFMASTSGVSPQGVISLTLYEAALESGFGAEVVDGGQAVFSRIRIRADVTVPGTYTVTHPYGVETFEVAAVGNGNEINFTNDVPGLVPGQFDAAVSGGVGFGPPTVGPTYLTNADGTLYVHPVTGERYIGDNATPVAVQGGLNGINTVTISGGGDTLTLDTFVLMGKVFDLQLSPNALDVLGKVGASASTTFTITNSTGSPAAIALTGIAAPYSVANDTCTTDAAAQPPVPALPSTPGANTCTFDLVFSPLAEGPANATIGIAGTPTTVAVNGTGDGTAPAVGIAPLTFTSNPAPSLSGTASDANGVSSVTVSVNGGAPQTASIANGAWSLTSLAGLTTDGTYNIVATASDTALPAPGNQGTASSTITLDRVAPTVAVDPLGFASTTARTLPITGTAADSNGISSIAVSLNGTLQGLATATGGNWSFSVSDMTPNAANQITAVATDSAGNATTSAPVAVTFEVPRNGDMDLDDDVDISDALLSLRTAVKLATPTPEQLARGDVFPLDTATPAKPAGDNKNDISDALLILRRVVKLVTF